MQQLEKHYIYIYSKVSQKNYDTFKKLNSQSRKTECFWIFNDGAISKTSDLVRVSQRAFPSLLLLWKILCRLTGKHINIYANCYGHLSPSHQYHYTPDIFEKRKRKFNGISCTKFIYILKQNFCLLFLLKI